MLFGRFFGQDRKDRFPMLKSIFPRLWALLTGESDISSIQGRFSLLPRSGEQNVMKNLEEWEIVRDPDGRLLNIKVHRDVKY